MRRDWLAYGIVAVLAVGAGVAIAGLPDDVPAEATIATPTATDIAASATSTSAPTDMTATTTAGTPDTGTPDTSTPDTSTPDNTATTEPGDTTSPTTSAPPSTEPPAPTTTESADLVPRAELLVTAANGSNVAGTAARSAEFLESIGYVDVATRDGTVVEEFTVIYYAEGFEDEADRLADDWDLFPEFVAPIDDAPNVIDLLDDTQLLAYVGLDRS